MIGKPPYFERWAQPDRWSEAVDSLQQTLTSHDFDFVAGVESLGLPIAGAIADRFKCGLVTVRKGRGDPRHTFQVVMKHYRKGYEYLHLKHTPLLKGARVVITDDTIRTGQHIEAAITLLKKSGAIVVAVACLSEIFETFNSRSPISVPIISVERIGGFNDVIGNI